MNNICSKLETMETLKLKIFDILTEKITVSEFENWLYDSEYLKHKITEDSLIFNVININYKEEDAINRIEEIASEIFSDEEFLIVKIERYCFKIINSDNTDDYKNYVSKIIENFDFDNDSEPYWDFYNIYYSFDGYDMCEYENSSSEHVDYKAKKYAKSVIEKLMIANSIKEKVTLLKQKEEKTELNSRFTAHKNNEKVFKSSFLNKILAFFKKI